MAGLLRKKIFSKKKHSLYIQWLVSYLLILIIPLSFCGVIYYHSITTLESEINQANTSLLDHMKQILDLRMNEVIKFGAQLSSNTRVSSLVMSEAYNTPIQKDYYYNARMNMNDIKSTNTFISDFYIVFHDKDKIITGFNQTDRQSLYNSFHRCQEQPYEAWIDSIIHNDRNQFKVMYRLDDTGNPVKCLAYLQSLPFNAPTTPVATLVIITNESEIFNSISSIDWLNQGTVALLNSDDSVFLASNNQTPPLFPVKYSGLTENRGILKTKIDGEACNISYTTSEISGWKYVSILPYNILWNKYTFLNRIFLIFTVLCLLVGIGLVLKIVKHNYVPLKKLVNDALDKSTETALERSANEYDIIKNYFDSIADTNTRLEAILKDKATIEKNNFINRVLTKHYYEELSPEAFQRYGVSLISDRFAVLLFYIEDYSSLFSEEKLYYGKKPEVFVDFIIENVVQELINAENSCILTHVDGCISCVINFSPDCVSPEELVENTVYYVYDFFQERFHLYFTVAASNVHTGLDQLAGAYDEAKTALTHRMILGRQQVIFYSHLKQADNRYYYSLNVEENLISNIKAGNRENAKTIIDNIFSQSSFTGPDAIVLCKCLMHDLASTFIKLCNSIEAPQLLRDINPIDRILLCETIFDLKTELDHTIDTICDYVDSTGGSIPLNARICQYIEENYHDINLNVNLIGEAFHMAPSYLSKLFKQQTGQSLPDYINKVRVDRAKELLRGTEETIGVISEQVGYVSSNSFIRIFKKIEGITPGQYRENEA